VWALLRLETSVSLLQKEIFAFAKLGNSPITSSLRQLLMRRVANEGKEGITFTSQLTIVSLCKSGISGKIEKG
jgi:hypothetical protein